VSNRPRNYCGSSEPGHRSTTCKPCQATRQRERRARLRAGVRYLGPSCALCGIAQRNSYGIPVYRYSLVRNVRATHTKTGWTNRQVASIPLCDRCLVENGYARSEYVRAA
jgi:hypothetical protein